MVAIRELFSRKSKQDAAVAPDADEPPSPGATESTPVPPGENVGGAAAAAAIYD